MKLRTLIASLSPLALLACSTSDTQPAPAVDGTDSAVPADAASPPAPKDAAIFQDDAADAAFVCNPAAPAGSFYALSSPDLGQTRTVSMCEYRGDVVLVVNVASACGYTPQYKPLQAVFEKYGSKGFTILGFPCNQFGAQEPDSDKDISTFCTAEYGITFPMFTKSNVNPPTENPIYSWLKAQPGGAGAISWNFNKFLLSRKGVLIKRYDSTVTPDDPSLTADIEAAIAAAK